MFTKITNFLVMFAMLLNIILGILNFNFYQFLCGLLLIIIPFLEFINNKIIDNKDKLIDVQQENIFLLILKLKQTKTLNPTLNGYCNYQIITYLFEREEKDESK